MSIDVFSPLSLRLSKSPIFVLWCVFSLTRFARLSSLKLPLLASKELSRGRLVASLLRGAFHLSELIGQTIPILMRISLSIKTIQPDQSNPI